VTALLAHLGRYAYPCTRTRASKAPLRAPSVPSLPFKRMWTGRRCRSDWRMLFTPAPRVVGALAQAYHATLRTPWLPLPRYTCLSSSRAPLLRIMDAANRTLDHATLSLPKTTSCCERHFARRLFGARFTADVNNHYAFSALRHAVWRTSGCYRVLLYAALTRGRALTTHPTTHGLQARIHATGAYGSGDVGRTYVKTARDAARVPFLPTWTLRCYSLRTLLTYYQHHKHCTPSPTASNTPT